MLASEITERVHARVGLLGNPSDGYHGACKTPIHLCLNAISCAKTCKHDAGISFSLANFWAEVTLRPSLKLTFEMSPVHDLQEFEGLAQFKSHVDGCSYYGGVRLLQATVKVVYDWCLEKMIELPKDRNFTLSYTSNIPRQTGLSGSSAICCAGDPVGKTLTRRAG